MILELLNMRIHRMHLYVAWLWISTSLFKFLRYVALSSYFSPLGC